MTVDPSGAYCSILPPDQDKTHWRLLELQIEDDDWAIIRAAKDSGELDIMYAKVFGKIGMGTEQPKQHGYDIHDDRNNGDYLFAPDQSAAPEFIIQQSGEVSRHLSQSVADNKAKFTTDTEGFLFQPAIQPPCFGRRAGKRTGARYRFYTGVYHFPAGRAATGIGTVTPEAAVDAQQGLNARVLLAPLKKDTPEIAFVNKGEYNLRTCYVNRLDANSTQFITNAPEGFLFQERADRLQ